MKKILIIIGASILILFILILFPNLHKIYMKKGNLYINEIMASNKKTIQDNDGDYSDYIELYNGYSQDINLNGYHLSDSEYETNKWTFPNITIKSHEYLIIYASGKDECNIDERICHTNFKLSSKGEVLTLSDKNGNIISKITFQEQFSDISYGYIDGKYIYFSNPTPGEENKSEEYKIPSVNEYKLEINEYMTHNKRFNYDSYGNYFDWVEIYNPTSTDYELENIYISDNISNIKKYKIPTVTIKSHEYLIIYMAGESKDYDDGIYADFSLSDDEDIIISNGKDIIDKVKVVSLYDNISYGKVDGEWGYFVTPTPGKANTTAHFTSIGGLNGSS